MEFAKTEIAEIEKAANAAEAEIRELNDLQLALIGGGTGETSLG